MTKADIALIAIMVALGVTAVHIGNKAMVASDCKHANKSVDTIDANKERFLSEAHYHAARKVHTDFIQLSCEDI